MDNLEKAKYLSTHILALNKALRICSLPYDLLPNLPQHELSFHVTWFTDTDKYGNIYKIDKDGSIDDIKPYSNLQCNMRTVVATKQAPVKFDKYVYFFFGLTLFYVGELDGVYYYMITNNNPSNVTGLNETDYKKAYNNYPDLYVLSRSIQFEVINLDKIVNDGANIKINIASYGS